MAGRPMVDGPPPCLLAFPSVRPDVSRTQLSPPTAPRMRRPWGLPPRAPASLPIVSWASLHLRVLTVLPSMSPSRHLLLTAEAWVRSLC